MDRVDVPLETSLDVRRLRILSTFLRDMPQDGGMDRQSRYTELGTDDGIDVANGCGCLEIDTPSHDM